MRTTAFERRGIRVIFFEMPINPALCNMPLLTSIRNLIRTQFPSERYFRIGDCNAVTTEDGVHLSYPEDSMTVTAVAFTSLRSLQPSFPVQLGDRAEHLSSTLAIGVSPMNDPRLLPPKPTSLSIRSRSEPAGSLEDNDLQRLLAGAQCFLPA